MRFLKTGLLTVLLLFASFLISYGQDDVVEKQLEQLAKNLAMGIKAQGKSRVAVSDLTDLQSLPTELGKYLAVGLQGNLVNNGLRVVNRDRINELLAENAMTTKGLLDPKNATKLQKATGIEVIVIGTTTPFDKNVSINLLAIELEKAEAIASAKTSIPRTQSIDLLIQTVVRNEAASYRETNAARPSAAAVNSEIGDWEKPLSKRICTTSIGSESGMYCFDNRFNVPILLYEISNSNVGIINPNVLIAPGNTGCSPMVHLGSQTAIEKSFYFKTVSGPPKKGFVTLTIEGCKEKHMALTPANFYMKDAEDRR